MPVLLQSTGRETTELTGTNPKELTMLSRRKALSLATLLLPQLYFAGIGSAQQPTPRGAPPPAGAAPRAGGPPTPAREGGAPGGGKRAGEKEIIVPGPR